MDTVFARTAKVSYESALSPGMLGLLLESPPRPASTPLPDEFGASPSSIRSGFRSISSKISGSVGNSGEGSVGSKVESKARTDWVGSVGKAIKKKGSRRFRRTKSSESFSCEGAEEEAGHSADPRVPTVS